MDGVLILGSTTKKQNIFGVWESAEVTREVFCQVDSVSRSEFYNAGRKGLNPEYKFTVFQGDYNGEDVCSYDGSRYGIYRTYHVPGSDYVELYAERKGGTNGN